MDTAGVLPGVQIKWWSELQVPFKSIIPLLSGWERGAVSLMSHYSSRVTEWSAGSRQTPWQTSWNQKCWKNLPLRLLPFILWNRSGNTSSSGSQAGNGSLCPRQCLDMHRPLWGVLKGLLLASSAWRPGTHGIVSYPEKLHWRKCQFVFVAKAGLISWGMCTAVPKSPSPLPQILNRSPCLLWIYRLK